MRSLRDSDGIGRLWSRSDVVSSHLGSLSQSVNHIQRQINTLRVRKGYGSGGGAASVGQFPFRIYPCPGITLAQQITDYPETVNTEDGGSSADPTEDITWRLYRVRAGKVGTANVAGTDGVADYAAGTAYGLGELVDSAGYVYQSLQAANTGHAPASSPTWWEEIGPSLDENPFTDPDNDSEPGYDSDVDFLIPAGETWSFWVNCTDMDAPFVGAAEDEPEEGWGPNYVWIGDVDCATYADDESSFVRQIRRADIPTAWGCVDGEEREIPL